MATVYSLICWGGSAGKSVTVSSTTDLVTLTNHGLRNSAGVQFTSGTLPTVSGAALALNTTYYAKSISISTFELYYDPALTSRIDFTSNGSSLILKGAYYRTISDYTRWGGSTGRIYDGILSALTSRLNAPALPGDDEVFEIAEAFDEIKNSGVSTATFPSKSLTITSRLDGSRTTAYHHGVVGSGYRYISAAADNVLNANSYYVDVDGLEFCTDTTTNSTYYHILTTGSSGFFATIRNNIVNCLNTGEIHGIGINNTSTVYNNIVINIKGATCGGFNVSGGGGCVVYNNLATKCSVGFLAQTNTQGLFYNNLSVGNTVNWAGSPQFAPVRADGNIGTLSETTTFTVTSGTRTMTTSVNVPFKSYSRCFVTTSGTLPTVGGVELRTDRVYYAVPVAGNDINISTSYNGGTVTFDGVGTGTHTIHWVWATSQCPTNYIDFSDPTLVFADWTNNDFRPAGTGSTPASQAKMVDTAVTVMGAVTATDIADKERPNYNNGGFEYKDVGPFEYDRGYGPRPASHTLTLDNVVVGSRILIESQDGATQHYNNVAATSTVAVTIQVYGDARDDWRIRVRKASDSPYYRPWNTLMTAEAGESSIYVEQQLDE